MPIPERKENENKSEFISRCMSDPVMNREYPDRAQRYAICNQKSMSYDTFIEAVSKLTIGSIVEADYHFAVELRNKFPQVWQKYGNDELFNQWTRYRVGFKDALVLAWIKERKDLCHKFENRRDIEAAIALLKAGLYLDDGEEFTKDLIKGHIQGCSQSQH